ncbi:MAG: 3-deoxy-D-manno-octulosonic acid transferase [Alphaproteobacteria bacterium]
MSKPFLIIIYKTFTHCLNLFTWIIFITRAMKKKEEWIRKKERFGIVDNNKKSNNYILLHAASVGELLSIQPLVKKLLNENYDILVTTTTVSSAKLFKKIFPIGVEHQYIPYDIPKYTKRFF